MGESRRGRRAGIWREDGGGGFGMKGEGGRGARGCVRVGGEYFLVGGGARTSECVGGREKTGSGAGM